VKGVWPCSRWGWGPGERGIRRLHECSHFLDTTYPFFADRCGGSPSPVPAPVLPNRAVRKCEHGVPRRFCVIGRGAAQGVGRNSSPTTIFQKSPHDTFLGENNADGLLNEVILQKCKMANTSRHEGSIHASSSIVTCIQKSMLIE
jgi:hypothetical protein